MRKKSLLVFAGLVYVLCWSCEHAFPTEAPQEEPRIIDSAQWIVDLAIAAHGGERIASGARVSFEFRDRQYVATRQGGRFQYERIFTDSAGANIRDVLTHQGFFRERDGRRVELSPRDSGAFANSVNSVVYFSLLPYFLNDKAVVKEYLGQGAINGVSYHKVKITFREDGGGKDHEDEYVYWFHRDRHTLDYLAYNFLVDGGGARFREAYNQREINGIRFADYLNYRPADDSREVASFDSLYEAGGMVELSRIEKKALQVEVLAQ
jgi:hypothetical protein